MTRGIPHVGEQRLQALAMLPQFVALGQQGLDGALMVIHVICQLNKTDGYFLLGSSFVRPVGAASRMNASYTIAFVTPASLKLSRLLFPRNPRFPFWLVASDLPRLFQPVIIEDFKIAANSLGVR